MAASSFHVYDIWKAEMGTNGGNMSSLTFMMVMVSSGYTPSLANDLSSTGHTTYSVSAAAGQLSATPHALTNAVWGGVGSNTYRFDADDATFTYSAVTANKYGVIYRKSDGKLVCYADLETGAANGIEATKVIIQFSSNGIFSVV